MKTCIHCGKPFEPKYTSMQVACSLRCAAAYARKERVGKEQEARRRLETIPELIKSAQKEFNAYIRERDKDKPCICCGRFKEAASLSSPGGDWDCGHYRSTGSAPHLRFHEDNAHRQLKVCNRFGAGRAVDYRIGLVGRIGLHAVEALEADNRIHKWTKEELRSIRDHYKAKLKELKRVEA